METQELEFRLRELERIVEELRQKNNEQDTHEQDELAKINKDLDRAIKQLDMYRYFIIFIRALLASVVIVLTLRFGAIKEFFIGVKG